jgi:Ig-like domain-containing protein
MKKNLLAFFALCFCAISVRADLVYKDTFSYPNGPIIQVGTNTDGSTNWFHTGGATAADLLVNNHKAEISATGGTVSRAEDVHCGFPSAFTTAQTIMYASFTVNVTNLPPAAGAYFAHFWAGGNNFHARVFAQAGSLPNTWRLGVAAGAGSPNQILPIDLAKNTDYLVVLEWDPTGFNAATMWVNPISPSDPSVVTGDLVTIISPADALGFGLRQASSFGSFFCTMSNLSVATTFEESTTNAWATNAIDPVVVLQPKSGTNFVGDTVNLMALAAGQGLGSMTYQWQKNGLDVPNPNINSNVFNISSATEADSGEYRLIATTPYGLSATSAIATLWVTNPPVPPTISQQPTNTTVYQGQTAILKVTASGVAPLSYQWYYNGSPATGPNVSGADTDTLSISDVRTNNGTAGTYRCDVSNPFGSTPSSNAILSAISAPVVTIDYLRGLVDPTFYLPTNTTALYTATGVVTSHTNMTAPPNVQFYIHDGTAGITVFVAGGVTAGIQPDFGDSVTATGPLGQFNSLLELNMTTADPAQTVVTNSTNNLIPPGIVLPLTFTNGVGYGGVSNAIHRFQGAYVTLTNIYFPDGFTGANFAAGSTYIMTNSSGDQFKFFMNAAMKNLDGLPIPPFAWTVSGPMSFFLGNTAADRSAGFELDPTSYDEIVTNAPPAVTSLISVIGSTPTITWIAQPYMSYSILRASDVNGPYLPVATGLTFNTTAGQFVDSSAGAGPAFYRVISP